MSSTGIANNNCNHLAIGILAAVFSVIFFSALGHTATPLCGNAIAEVSEQCDYGSQINEQNCASSTCCSVTCTIVSVCGNAIAEPGEQCDLGNPLNGTKCSFCNFIVPAFCGNGILEPGELCDPSLQPNTCNADCTPNLCGDGKIGPGEQCDAHGASVVNCNSNCRFSNCLDGILNTKSGEECDPGMVTGSCNGNCRISRCGDSIINTLSGEQCDPPGNRTNGDTCTATCQIVLASLTNGGGTTAPADTLVSTGAIVGIVVGVVSIIALIPLVYKGFRWGQKKGYWRPITPAPLKPNPMFNAASPSATATPSVPAQGAATTTTAAVPKLNVAATTTTAAIKKPLPAPPVTP